MVRTLAEFSAEGQSFIARPVVGEMSNVGPGELLLLLLLILLLPLLWPFDQRARCLESPPRAWALLVLIHRSLSHPLRELKRNELIASDSRAHLTCRRVGRPAGG